jgi:hypothetical protein
MSGRAPRTGVPDWIITLCALAACTWGYVILRLAFP